MRIPGYKPTPQDVEEMSRLIKDKSSGGGTGGVNNRGELNRSSTSPLSSFCSGCKRMFGILGRVTLGIMTLGVSELVRLGINHYHAKHSSNNGPRVKSAPFNGQPFQ